MRLLLSIFRVLYKELETKLMQDLATQKLGGSLIAGSKRFWEFEATPSQNFFLKQLKTTPSVLSATYLRKLADKQSKADANTFVTVGKTDAYIGLFLTYLCYEGQTVGEQVEAFLASLPAKGVAPVDIMLQRRPRATKSKKGALPELSAPMNTPLRILAEKAPLLENTNFWFFFYGYDLFQGLGNRDGHWPLVKLLLTFTGSNGLDIGVKITNTGDPEHHHYIGKTDFEHSSDSVLVINCRTDPGYTRQLNIKLHIGTARGNIFLGQYLNYESDGRIISGNIIVQRIPDGIPLTPTVHRIPPLTGDNKIYTADYEGVDKSIIQYLHNKKINFRRNPLRAGHELHSLAEWLENHP